MPKVTQANISKVMYGETEVSKLMYNKEQIYPYVAPAAEPYLYIPSGCYFLIGYCPNTTSMIECKFSYNTHNTTASERCIFGTSGSSSSWYSDSKVFAITVNRSSTSTINNVMSVYCSTYKDNLLTNYVDDTILTVQMKWNDIIVNGTDYGNVWNNTTYAGATYGLALGAMMINGSYSMYSTKPTINWYYMNVYEDGVLKRNYIPYMNGSTASFKETINGTVRAPAAGTATYYES